MTSDKLKTAIDAKPGKEEQIFKADLRFYRITHKSDMKACTDLFKLNKSVMRNV